MATGEGSGQVGGAGGWEEVGDSYVARRQHNIRCSSSGNRCLVNLTHSIVMRETQIERSRSLFAFAKISLLVNNLKGGDPSLSSLRLENFASPSNNHPREVSYGATAPHV